MTELAKKSLLASLDIEDRYTHAPVRAKINGADLSLTEQAEIVRSLGGVICSCALPKPLGPAGSCPDCLAEGPFYQAALEYAEETKKARMGEDKFHSVSLSSLLKEGIPDPVLLCQNFLYEGGLHSIAGAPDSGKTTIALAWALLLLREGEKVLFLDEEGGEEIVTEKLAALGATVADLESLTYIPFPGRSWDAEDVAALLDLAKEIGPKIMLVDSSAAFLARAGLDENNASDVTNFWSRVLTPVARQVRTGVLVIDHDTKASEQSRYARGSGAKLAAIDVQFKVEMTKPFSRYESGMLKLLVTKDRRGRLHRQWKIEVGTGDGSIDPRFLRDGADPQDWSPAKRKIYGILEPGKPKSNWEIREELKKLFPDEGAPVRETVSRELNDLLREGRVGRTGKDNDYRWTKCRPQA